MTIQRRTLFATAAISAAGMTLTGCAAQAAKAEAAAAAFVPPTAEKPLLLCFNENPLGMSPAAKKAVAAAAEKGSRYPFARVEVLRKAVAQYMGGKTNNILLTHGSAEAIRASIESYKTADVQVVAPELTYSDGTDTADKNGMKVTRVAMGKDWSIDIAAMKKAVSSWKGSSVVYFVNPNNPTSTIVNSTELLDWIASRPARTVFVVDEAYAEFVADPTFKSAKTLVDAGFENVIVLRTFSKIFAMAGMRLGFAYAVPATIARVKKHVAYDIMMSVPAIEAALAELADPAFLTYSREQNAEARTILTAALDKLGIAYLPSQTNFVFMNLKAPLKPFADRMKAEAIWVGRPFPPALTWCRVSLGTPAETAYFVKKLFEFREKGWV
mgnify:FL=1